MNQDNPPTKAISPQEAGRIATEVERLAKAGDVRIAWERIRYLHPADVANILAGLPGSSRAAMVRVMSPDTAAWMLKQLNPLEASRFTARVGARALSTVLRQIRPMEALATLRLLPRSQAIKVADELEQPLVESKGHEYEEDTAGAVAVTDLPIALIDETVESTLDRLRASERGTYEFTHLFALDSNRRLEGQVSMTDLALADGDATIRSITRPVLAFVSPSTSLSECARLNHHYDLSELAVVEDERLVGVIPQETLLSAVVMEDTRQMLNISAVSGEGIGGPVTQSIKTRLPWLTVNLATTFLAAAVIGLFESTLAQVVVLAAFLPVISGQAGIGGTQTLTLIVRAIAMGELVGFSAWRVIKREALLGLFHGVWFGAVVAVIALVWQQNLTLSIILGVSMIANMVIAATFGSGVPLLLRRFGLDPAAASAVVVTTFTDVLGFLIFLGLAGTFVSLLI